jgi:hypothetical protein
MCEELENFNAGTAYPELLILILHVFIYIFMLENIYLLP